jgi:sugar transferase (PEP-CTERM/EpsH1 system associated)
VKILFVCHRFPFPPKRGGKIRPFNVIRHLHRVHDVTVASLVRSDEEAEEGEGLREHCSRFEMVKIDNAIQTARMVARLPTAAPSSIGYFHSALLARRIRRLLADESFDLVFVHCSSAAHYVADAIGTRKILDFGDMDSQKWLEYAHYKPFPLNLGYRLEGIKLAAEEKRLARSFDFCTATTRGEWETLQSYATGVPADWFPNGVDSRYFAPGETPYDEHTLCFIGRMDYYPNQACVREFCVEAFPRIRERRPDASFLIVGADPDPSILALGKLPGVTVTGSVPDVRPYLRRAAAMVAPLRIARGTQNKILEAMATGVPVVTSSTAARGVDAVPGEHLLVADTSADIAEAAVRLMNDRDVREKYAKAGRARVVSHHAWDASMQRLDRIIERCMNASAARSHGSALAPPSAARTS